MFPKEPLIALHYAQALEASGLISAPESVTSFSVHMARNLPASDNS